MSTPPSDFEPQALLRDLPVAAYTTDAAGRITYFNAAAARLCGGCDFPKSLKFTRPDGAELGREDLAAAIALKERRAVTAMEIVALRPGMTPLRLLNAAMPLFDQTGRAAGAISTLVEIDEEAGERPARHYAAIVESSDDAILSKDLDGIITSWNRGAQMIFGYTAEEVVGKSVTILIPVEHHDEEPTILGRIRRGERIDHYETIRRRKDGALIDISLTVSPIRDAQGRIFGASKIARDITERKRAQEQQRLLLREMDHRVRNLFAISSSLVVLSARTAQTADELAAKLRARLGALARAHALLFANESEGAERPTTLEALIRAIVSPYDSAAPGGPARVGVTGPDFAVSPGVLTNLALVLNEFATNATKYGALSAPEGSIEIAFSDDGDNLALTWTERGGPTLDRSGVAEGFGSFLVRTTVVTQLSGEIAYDWAPAGVTVRLSIPRDRLAP